MQEFTALDFPATVRKLASFNTWRLSPEAESAADEQELHSLELDFVEVERGHIAERAACAPTDAPGFLAWFSDLERVGPGQHDPLFDYLEERATLDEMKWFLRQELAGEAGFDDLVALTQVKMPTRAKLELARNYWDEMGQGHPGGMHGPMLSRLAEELGIQHAPEAGVNEVVWESLALSNLMLALAAHRRHAYRSIGALGAIELTAPGRARKVNAGLKRLGIGGEARRYFALHATLDVKHSEDWNREIIGPLVENDPRLARPIAEGALLRLRAGQRCFERYKKEIGLTRVVAAAS